MGIASALESLERVKSWCTRVALPFWGEIGFDEASGSFHERLAFTGQPITSAPQRTLVQGRQIAVFAQAARSGWFPGGGEHAIRAADTMISRHWGGNDQPGWVYSVAADGAIVDATRASYTQAFALFGLAWAYRLQPEARYLALADQTFAFMDRHLTLPPHGGFVTHKGPDVRERRQNPHMHLFEAALAWYDVTGESRFLARADQVFQLFEEKFFQPDTSILVEDFSDDWKPAAGARGRTFEPGHHFEWVWLLHTYAQHRERNVQHFADALYLKASRFGTSKGMIVDAVLDNGTIADRSFRSWPHTEALKAAASEHLKGRASMPDMAESLLETLETQFLGKPFPAGWLDHFNADGSMKVDFVPASTLYHIVFALGEADRIFNRQDTLTSQTNDPQ